MVADREHSNREARPIFAVIADFTLLLYPARMRVAAKTYGLWAGPACLLAYGPLLAQPTIQITNFPPFGSSQDLGGYVANSNPASNRVAVFIFVPGAGWFSKPGCAQPLTTIQPNGSWTADITTGGSDQLATKIAALLVSTNYSGPCLQGLTTLPTNVTAQALASVTVERDDPSIRRFDFSGYNWWVKSSPGTVGPGPNYFSDSTSNVWLDASNRLHLRITNRSNQWQCAEIITHRTFGYGSYRFALDSPVDNLDRNAVLGLFTWSDDAAFDHREIDIECSRWGNAADPTSAQYVVQPYDTAGHLLRITVPASVTNSTHLFTWETNRISFQSLSGGFANSPRPANVISNWIYTLTVPPTGDENIRINLWLNQGNAPSNEVEVVVRSFEFVPLGAPQPALLTNLVRPINGQIQFNINGQPDWRYAVERSSNFLAWENVGTLLASNNVTGFLDTNSVAADRRFYRTVTLP